MGETKAYIIILNWNGWQDTLECLESVRQLDYPDFQVVVVDNGSTDESVEKVRTWMSAKQFNERMILLETKANLGYAGGNNVGLRYALTQADLGYAWVLNNDTIVDKEALGQMVKRMQEKPGAGMCGSIILNYHQRQKIAAVGGGAYDRWFGQAVHPGADKQYDAADPEKYLKFERKLGYIEGASTFVSRRFLQQIGLMSEEYFLFFEEIDWATRGRQKFSLAIAPRSLVYHKGGASVQKKVQEGQKNNRYGTIFDYYNTRNRLLFTIKYYPYALPIVFLSILGYCLDRLLHGAWINVGIIGRGVVDAILGIDSRRR